MTSSKSEGYSAGEPIRITRSVAIPLGELHFEFVRSGGPGGQHVNKVATRVDLVFNVRASRVLSDPLKQAILEGLKSRVDSSGTLRITAQTSRSQWQNRQDVVRKFAALLASALAPRRKRVATAPTRGSRTRRRVAKEGRSNLKRLRGKIQPE
jgi:ribosome-associated protein